MPEPARRRLDTEQYVEGILAGDRSILARSITLVESNAHAHFEQAQAVLSQIMAHTGNSIRVGITGVPGAGKSTLIEALGGWLVDQGHRVAVLAVDPSSHITGGSIMGDKTRMSRLSQHSNAFIRPSPSGGVLGGVARKTRETMLVCEAAGFDIILVETVGTGQSEITVRSMVDFLLLVTITGAGDELQGIKKGIIEIADAIVINKADGDNKLKAQAARVEYNRALHYLSPLTDGWRLQAYTCSAKTGEGISEIWQIIEEFQTYTVQSGIFAERRRQQNRDWLYSLIEQQFEQDFFNHPAVRQTLPEIEQAAIDGSLPTATAASTILEIYRRASLK